MVHPTWLTAFIDVPAERYDEGAAFWRDVTGYGLSPGEGDSNEYVTLLPPDGDPHLRIQRLERGNARVHVDLHHRDQEFRVLSSPAGLPFCHVYADWERRAAPVTWPGGHWSIVDQISLDIPPSLFDQECEFWSDRTGWALADFPEYPEFRSLVRPPDQPIRMLLQRLDDESEPARVHLDVATNDREAELSRHQALGASFVRRHPHWTVLRDPIGMEYCLVDRSQGPETQEGASRTTSVTR